MHGLTASAFILVFFIWKYVCGDHVDDLYEIDNNLTDVKCRIGKLYSQNSALLHKMNKLDEFIKRGADMETRYIIEIVGYPFNQDAISPEDFLQQMANALHVNFNTSHIRGLRIMAGRKYSAKLIVDLISAKIKRSWLKAYKNKLYQVSWGEDPEKTFGTKEKYRFFEHKTVYLQDFLPVLCNKHMLEPIPFIINDYISPYRKRLLAYAKLLAARYRWRFVWVSEGDIFVRKSNGEPGVYIRSEKDFRCMDWRLQSETYFWTILNECNMRRREELQYTAKRVLPWMTTRADAFVRKREYKESLLNYKRKFDDEMKVLLSEGTHNPNETFMMGAGATAYEGLSKYQFVDYKVVRESRSSVSAFIRNYLK